MVRNRFLIVPETLAHSGVYFQDETIHLSDSQAAEMMRRDRASGSATEPLLKPDIPTPEQHAKALESCRRRGIELGDWVREEDQKLDVWAHEKAVHASGNHRARLAPSPIIDFGVEELQSADGPVEV